MLRFCGSIGESCLSFTTLPLLDVQHSVTAGACVVGILKLVHEEGYEAAAQHQSEADEEQTHEPCISAGLVGDIGHDLLLAGGAGGHPRVKAQGGVVAHILIFVRFRGRRVQPSCVHWQLCGVALWRSEGGVDMINLDSTILSVHWHHVWRRILSSIHLLSLDGGTELHICTEGTWVKKEIIYTFVILIMTMSSMTHFSDYVDTRWHGVMTQVLDGDI